MSDFALERENATAPAKPKRSYAASGFAGTPGRGPAGESCGTCTHCVKRTHRGAAFHKCGLLRAHWNKSPRTDITRGSPACELFMKKEVVNGGGLEP